LITGDFKIAAIAIAVSIKEDSQVYDAVQIRFYESNTKATLSNHKYLCDDLGVLS